MNFVLNIKNLFISHTHHLYPVGKTILSLNIFKKKMNRGFDCLHRVLNSMSTLLFFNLHGLWLHKNNNVNKILVRKIVIIFYPSFFYMF